MTGTRLALCLGAVLCALAAAGCMSDDSGGAETDAAPTTTVAATTEGTTTAAPAPEGGFENFRVVYDTGLDYLDPALAYTIQAWSLLWHVYVPLLTYRHESGAAGADVVPGLATELPAISDDGLRYTFRIRREARYSNGRPVLASDFKRAIERLFEMDSPGADFFRAIEGADKPGDGIEGIEADDASRTVVFHLVAPQADFQHVLATTFAAPVPKGTPARDQSEQPIPATGPYVIRSYKPNANVVLVRNRRFAIPGLPATPNRITVRIVESDDEAIDRVIADKADYSAHVIPSERLEDIREQQAARLRESQLANTYYFFLNTRQPPFDKVGVRRAVNHAIDRRELVRLFGGLGRVTQNVLPPTYPSYRALDLYPFSRARARELVDAAGAKNAEVVVWSSSSQSSERAGEYLVDALNDIGLKARIRTVDPATYFRTVAAETTHAQAGVASWFQYYPHPLSWFEPLLAGGSIRPELTTNLSRANVPELNEGIERLRTEPSLTDEVNGEWAALDRLAMERALWAPFLNRTFPELFSSRIDLERCFVSHVLYRVDFSRICLK